MPITHSLPESIELLRRWSGRDADQEAHQLVATEIPALCHRLLANQAEKAAAWLWRCQELQDHQSTPYEWSRAFFQQALPSAHQTLDGRSLTQVCRVILDQQQEYKAARWLEFLHWLGGQLLERRPWRMDAYGKRPIWMIQGPKSGRRKAMTTYLRQMHTEATWQYAKESLEVRSAHYLLNHCMARSHYWRLRGTHSELLVFRYRDQPQCLHLRGTVNEGSQRLTADILPAEDYSEEPRYEP